MKPIKKYGLLGESLKHSYSKIYFEKKFDNLHLGHSYDLVEISSALEIPHLLSEKKLDGMNVTIPYKEEIIKHLDYLDDTAKKIGAVNTVVLEDGKYKGYNTDVFGFEEMFNHLPLTVERALVLGTGGASKAVQYALEKRKIPFMVVSRSDKHLDEQPYVEVHDLDLGLFNTVINATPLGMYPNVKSYPHIPYDRLNKSHMLLDLVYNPEETQFMKMGKASGAFVMNGLNMLHAQAEKSWELWNSNHKN